MNPNAELANGPILVGTDFSQASKSVVEYAATLAIKELKPLQLAHVMPLIHEEVMSTNRLREHVKAAAGFLSGSGLAVDGVLKVGTTAHELVGIADDVDAAYIVIGTEGLTGLERLLLGSAADAVIRKSDRPVIVVGPNAVRNAKKTLPWKHLMLACDTGHGVTEAARLAGNIAFGHHADLIIFNVKRNGLARLSEGQFDAMEQMMSREVWLTVKPQCLIRAGDPAKAILQMVEDSQADLLVMSVHSGGELLSHLREGIIAKVLRLARCPVMILRDLPTSHHDAHVLSTTDQT